MKQKPTKKAAPKKKAVVKRKPAVKVHKPTPEEIAEAEEEARRMDWEVNHELITEAFYNEVLKKKKMPTYKRLGEITGLSVKTITRHFEDNEILVQSRNKIRALRDRALLTVGIKAISGNNVNWARLFLESTEAEFVTKKIDATTNGQSINQGMSDAQFDKLLNTLNAQPAAN